MFKCIQCLHAVNGYCSFEKTELNNIPDGYICSAFILETNETDIVNHPAHYETGKYECIDVMIETQGAAAVKEFCICNAFKYLYRHRNKGGKEDIKKAKWYLNKYLEICDKEQ